MKKAGYNHLPLNLFPILIATGIVASGCNPTSHTGARKGVRGLSSAASTQTGSSPYSNPASNTDAICAEEPNIEPDYDWELDGTGYYTACASLASQETVYLQPKTQESGTLCVYPAQYYDESHLYWKPDPTGAPLVACLPIGEAGIAFNFAYTQYNAVFVVKSQHRDAMTECLLSGNSYDCPAYSFGRFR